MQTTTQRAAEEIRVALARQRKSQEWLAKEINMSGPSLSRRLSGLNDFRLDELDRIASVLDVSIADLVATPGRQAS